MIGYQFSSLLRVVFTMIPFLAIPRFYCGCCGIVCDADGCHAIPNGDSANILAIDTAIILFLIFIQSSFGHYQTTVCRNI